VRMAVLAYLLNRTDDASGAPRGRRAG